MKNNKKAFTLIEILLFIGLSVIFVGLIVSVDSGFLTRNKVALDTDSVAQSLRKAYIYSRNSYHGDGWGVRILDKSVVLYKGNSYENRDQSFDEVLELSSLTTFSGILDVSFEAKTGFPTQIGNVNVSDDTGRSKTIEINKLGLVDEN